MEKADKGVEEYDVSIYINKINALRIERLILNRQLNELIIEYNSLKMKNKIY